MIGFYNASVILTYLGVVSAVFGMSQAFNGNFKIAILCLMISGLTDMYDGMIAFLFVFDFKVFKPDKKCMLAFVVIGALIAVKMFLL